MVTRQRWSADGWAARSPSLKVDGLGGSAVLTDCVPSKTLIATAEVMTDVRQSADLGLRFGPHDQGDVDAGVRVHLATVNERVLDLARRQSCDITERLQREGINLVLGRGRLDGTDRVIATPRMASSPCQPT